MVNGWYEPQRAPNCARAGKSVPPAVSTERGPVFVPHLEEQELSWTDLDQRAVDTVRVLAADAVEKVGNGHPGTAMSLAPAAYLLFQKLMRHDPANPDWLGRDRFVLSPGHTSLTLYIQLFLSGYGLELKDLEALRTWGSLTPGHPEYKHTKGVEITTGPLGQGLASAVGFAYSQRRMRGLFDADAPAGTSPFDHTVWVIASDGDLQEGVTSEASSLAGHQELGNLVVIYDENHISIEDDTDVAFTEDVLARYEAYGWHTQRVDWTRTGEYVEDVQELHAALLAAKAETGKPSIISLRTIIGYPAPKKQNTGKIHGSALGAEEVAALKKVLGFDPERAFQVDEDVLAHARCRRGPRRGRPHRLAGLLRGVAGRQPRGRCPAGARRGQEAPGRARGRPAGLRSRQGRLHPRRLRQGPERDRPGHARTLGRLRRPRRVEQHHDRGLALVHPRVPVHRGVEGQPVRPGAALRHPRARRGVDRERHLPARAHPRVLRHVPDLLRLPAPRDPARRPDGRPVAVRLDARLDRPGRGRPHAPAGRAARLPARHPGPGRRPPGRRERGRRGLEGHAGKPRKPGRHRPDPAEHPHLRPRHRRGRRRHLRLRRRRRQGRLRPGRGVQGRHHRRSRRSS